MIIILLYSLFSYFLQSSQILVPIEVPDRRNEAFLELTEIGDFGRLREAREGIPAHLHSGIDIKRPSDNYIDASIYSIATGIVISKRTDGPFAQLIIEHDQDDFLYWTVYEHISGIEVELFQRVDEHTQIARFFNTNELNRYGWQFDHLHFEVLKKRPTRIEPSAKNPERLHNSFTLVCSNQETLRHYFYNPFEFLRKRS